MVNKHRLVLRQLLEHLDHLPNSYAVCHCCFIFHFNSPVGSADVLLGGATIAYLYLACITAMNLVASTLDTLRSILRHSFANAISNGRSITPFPIYVFE
jgi:hypothetical protein